MSKGGLLSILGLYEAEPTLFDNMVLPEGMNKETVIDAIIQDCMELEAVYTSPYAMKLMIGVWARRELPTFERIYKAERSEYNPIENYDRHQTDSREIKHSGDDVTTGTVSKTGQGSYSDSSENESSSSGEDGKTTTTSSNLSDTKTHKYAAFDGGDLLDQTQDVETANSSGTQKEQAANSQTTSGSASGSGTTSQTSSETNSSKLEHGENIGETFTSYIHGNIGVTTSQQMLESELEIAPKINTINYVVNSFKMRFCILVY